MRNVNGVLFVDKTRGVSSAFLLRQVKILFQARKVGHTGTLDPLATGMVVVCFGEATKVSQFLLQADKVYRVVAKLGERTDTFDSLGRVIHIRSVKKLNLMYLCKVLNTFIGSSYQTPPMFSALKYYGCPLYQYARLGLNVFRHPRLICIYKINLIRWDSDNKYIELEVFCSVGTYIRSFIDDLGESLGCGAHVISLRRCSIAQFSSKFMVDIIALQKSFNEVNSYLKFLKKLDALLYPVDIFIRHFPEINVSFDIYRLLGFGQKVTIDRIIGCYDKNSKNDELVRLTVGSERKFFGVGHVINHKYLLVYRLLYLESECCN